MQAAVASMQRRAAIHAAHTATFAASAATRTAAAAVASSHGRQWKGRVVVGNSAPPHAQRSFTVQRAQSTSRTAFSLSSLPRRFLSSSAASSNGAGESDGAASSNSSSSSSGSNSNDDTPNRRRALVAVTDKEVFAPSSESFLPVGQMPKSPQLLLLPIFRPVMPGLAFDYDLRLYPAETRAALHATIAAGQPYVAMVMLGTEQREAVQSDLRAANSGWSVEDRVRENFESDSKTDAEVSQQAAQAEQMRTLFGSTFSSLDSNASDPKRDRLPVYPVVEGLGSVHSFGVAAEIKIIEEKGVPRLSGIAHRRVQIMGVYDPNAAAAEAATVFVSEGTKGDAAATTDNAAAAAPATAEAPIVTDSTSAASASPAAPAASSSSSSADTAAPFTVIPSPLRVRVKHLDDLISVTESILATADGVGSVPAASNPSSLEDELEEKAYVKEINQTILQLTSEEYVSARLKRLSRQVRNMSSQSAPARVADLAAHIAQASESDLQRILETLSIKDRLRETLFLWSRESEEIKLRKRIAKNVKDKYEMIHQKHLLKEQRKVIDEMMVAANREQAEREAQSAAASGTAGTGAKVPPPPKGNDKESLRLRFLHRISAANGRTVPEYAQKVIDEELAKFASLDPDANEYQGTRNYIDWLTSIPWGVIRPEKFDLDFAETLLNREHYGLEEVKTRILEFIATANLLEHVPQGKILCLVGPPGVGKTSIGKSIASALDRKFYRFSVGGMEDVAEIKGHRRTYVSSMPGKLIAALKQVECSNPVILIDEIDKLGRGHRGDPASALLEVLDPEQNNAFADHYLDVPVDLSKVLFICTANDRSAIPGPLADRMDFITLSGYVLQEKMHIAQKHLIPALHAKTGVQPSELTLTEGALSHLIRWYCREAGVRGLQKQLDKIYRKVALKITRAQAQMEEDQKAKEAATAATAPVGVLDADIVSPAPAAAAAAASTSAASSSTATASPSIHPPIPSSLLQLPVVVDVGNLSEYVGKPVHHSDRMYDSNPVGVATGLGTNSMGGWLLYTECTTADQAVVLPPQAMRIPTAGAPPTKDQPESPRKPQPLGRGELFCTGQLGDVIRESSSIAYTVAKRLVAKYTHASSPHRHFFAAHRIHLHLPEGATPKDGPSAGIAMVTALLSLALNTPPIHAHAMTGELTLTGLVLPIGGVKDKLMAAKHASIRLVVLPAENRKDVAELQPFITEGMDIHYASTYDDVFKLIFPHFVDAPIPERSTEPRAKKSKKNEPAAAAAAEASSSSIPIIPGVTIPAASAPNTAVHTSAAQ